MDAWPFCLLATGTSIVWRHSLMQRFGAKFRMVERVIEDHILWYVLDGSSVMRTDRQSLTLRPGSLLWIPPGERHWMETPSGSRPIQHFTFRFQVLAHGQSQGWTQGAILQPDARELEADLRRLRDDHAAGDAWAQDRNRATLYLIYTSLIRPANVQRFGSRLSVHECAQMERLSRRPQARSLTPAALAKEVGLGADRFARVFKATYGVPPRRWLVERRIQEACYRLIHTRQAIGAIAESLGYGDRHLFNRQFRAVTGHTPSTYRSKTS